MAPASALIPLARAGLLQRLNLQRSPTRHSVLRPPSQGLLALTFFMTFPWFLLFRKRPLSAAPSFFSYVVFKKLEAGRAGSVSPQDLRKRSLQGWQGLAGPGLSDLWALRPYTGMDYCFIIIFLN